MGNVRPNLHEFADFAQRDAYRNSGFEHTVTKYLLQFYKLQKYKSEVEAVRDHKTGESGLSIAGFFARFPDFPVYLITDRLPYIHHDLQVAALFKSMQRRRIVQRFDDLVSDEVPEDYSDGNVGVVFSYPPISRGMILHNASESVTDYVKYAADKPCVRLIWPLSGKREQRYGPLLVLEPFQQFLSGLRDWEPAGV